MAADTFIVKDIRLEGLQRISAGTVLNYLPIKVGDTLDSTRTSEAIRALFKTGFFRDVRIERDGEVLVVSIVERFSIGSIEFTGNKDISTEDLESALAQVEFVEGRVFNRSIFDQVVQELRRAYFARGRYGALITSTVTPLERNRIAIKFDISEGVVSRIRQINVVGNTVFDDEELIDSFNLKTTNYLSFFTRSDRYSKPKLAADLETIRAFYLDRGFINFNIDSTQISITPDKRDIYITINITEGDRYNVRDIHLQGSLIVAKEELFELVTVVQGEMFSHKNVTETMLNIGERLGNEGYSFADVNAVPEIDADEKAVDLIFHIDPGKRVYVRRINFRGNAKTRDEVLRRETRQIESGWASTKAIKRTATRLERLDFFESVNVETVPVPGASDQVDIDFTVVEKSPGNLLLGAGLSQTRGVILNTSVTHENFLGTGNRLRASLNNSKANRDISVSWFNPYWTVDGVSRGLEVFDRRTDASDANLADYDLDQLGAGVTFGIPVSEFTSVNAGFTVENNKLIIGSDPSRQIRDFRDEVGSRFTTFLLSGSWVKDGRDSRYLPTTGDLTRLSSEIALPGGALTYYKIFARHQRLFPLPKDFVFLLEGEIGYGDGFGGTSELPLTDNFFAGGYRSVRGFRANTLGPRDSEDDALGGNLKLLATAELIFPLPFQEDSKAFRLTTFFDIGNVYGPDEDFEVDTLRYSVGISGLWLSPLGPLAVSFSAPLRTLPGDETQVFQFALGASF